MRSLAILCGAILPWLIAVGCAGSRLDAPFRAGQYLEVARLFEADSTLQTQEESLYLAGLAYGLPESPAYDPERAIATFDRLLALYATGTRRTHALHLQELLRETQEQDRLRREREDQLATATARLAEERARLEEVEALLSTERVRGEGLRTISDRLARDVRERNERIRALEEELAALKEIDLNRPSPEPAIGTDSTVLNRP